MRHSVELPLFSSLSDEVGVQNAVVYFWNSHLHLFRKNLGAHAMPEVTLDLIESDRMRSIVLSTLSA
jgi:hypothetical protein